MLVVVYFKQNFKNLCYLKFFFQVIRHYNSIGGGGPPEEEQGPQIPPYQEKFGEPIHLKRAR